MFIKQFRTHQVRVNDPLHPGQRTFEDRLIESGAGSISHAGDNYQADEDGWFEVPAEVGAYLLKFRAPGGEQFFEPHDVDENVRLGLIDSKPEPVAAVAGAAKRKSRR